MTFNFKVDCDYMYFFCFSPCFPRKVGCGLMRFFCIGVVYMNRFFREFLMKTVGYLEPVDFFLGGVGLACQGLPCPILFVG